MEEFIKKMISRLEEVSYNHYDLRLSDAIKIVNELKKEYINTSTVQLTNGGCVDCDECEHRSEECLCDISDNEDDCPLKHNGWIPCSERLPQENEPVGTLCQIVNVMLKNGTVTSGWCNRYLEKWYVLDHHHDYPLPYEYKDVIAWQPLPAQ